MIDGYPLDKSQAASFSEYIGRPSKVICLEIPEESAVVRLTTRGQFDDAAEAINKRLKIWNEDTRPLVKAFNGIIINADRAANEVLADVEKELK